MKRIITLLVLLFVNVYCNGQTLNIGVPPGPIDSGTSFDIILNPSSTPTGCTSQIITLNIGTLTYLGGATIDGGMNVAQSTGTNGIDKILTISNIVNTSGGVVSAFGIPVQFPVGVTCDGSIVQISGTITGFECAITPNPVSAIIKTVQANSVNNARVVFEQDPQNPICFGRIVKYNVRATNIGMNGYIINSPRLILELAECAEILGLYRQYTFTPITFTNTQGAGGQTQILQWDVAAPGYPTLDPTPADHNLQNNIYSLYVRYSCNECTQGLNTKPKVHLNGETTCEGIFNTPVVEYPTTFTGQNCPGNECTEGSSPTINWFTYYGLNQRQLPCITACNSTPLMAYNIGMPPSGPTSNLSYTNLIFEVGIPNQVDITQVASPPMPCTPKVEYLYGSTWTQIFSTTQRASRVRWTFDTCTVNTPVNLNTFYLYFNYNETATASVVNFDHSLTSQGTTIMSGISSPQILECLPSFNPNKLVKIKKTPDTGTFAHEVPGMPGDIFTYRLEIMNNGSVDSVNTIIEDVLNSNSVYNGEFKYAYAATNTSSITFLPLTENAISITELGTANVSLPAIGSSGTINLTGFTFPRNNCITPTKTLYIEFDVKINGVASGTTIPNAFRVNNTTSSSGNSTGIEIGSRTLVPVDMFVRCASNGTWSNSSVNVKSGEILDFKMKVENKGSNPVFLSEIINLKPQQNDKYELGSLPRNVDGGFVINYDSAPILVTNIPTAPLVTFKYSNNDANMDRTMFCPPANPSGIPANVPNWTAPFSTNVNWLKAEFPAGTILNPGQFVEIIYKGKVSGSEGTSLNSFAIKLVDSNGNCNFDSDDAEVTIVNDGVGCIGTQPPLCDNCASFDLLKGEKYLVSGWVKEASSNPQLSQQQFKKYIKSFIGVSFIDVNGNPIVAAEKKLYPTGEIIDGWQRIIGEFIVPLNVDDMHLELVNENTGSMMSYFDDIRVLPSKGNMKSFVYDQATQRLMAELDENNYSTFYEYDLEGGLIRIKKETEKGVFTIQETRSGNTKSGN